MTRRFEIGWGTTLLVVPMLLGVLLAHLPEPTTVDQWWHGVSGDMRTTALLNFAHGMDLVGAGVIGVYVVPLAIGAALLLMRDWRTAVFAVTAFACSALLIQAAKQLLGRSRPEDLLVVADYGSFPSGHTANAATIAIVLWIVFPKAVVAIAAGLWVLLMALSRTILSAHWITDTLGGAMLGAAAGLLVAATMLSWVTAAKESDGNADTANNLHKATSESTDSGETP